MPRTNLILFLPGFTIRKVLNASPLVIEATYNRKPKCPFCDGSKLRIKHSFMREVKHESVGLRRAYIRFKAHKFYCYACKRYFNQRFPGILKHQRATERLKAQVFEQHTQGVSQLDLAKQLKLGKSTIERWYQQHYLLRAQNIKAQHWPKILGIDEHFFSKKQRFATTFCDLKNHRIFDIVKGKSGSDLLPFINQLPGRERVKIACIDLSVTYRNLIKKHFPKALIVTDRFHVLRLIEQAFMKTCHSIHPQMKYHRGILAMFRTRPEHLTETKKLKLKQFLDEHPAIQVLYQFKERLFTLLKHKHRKAKECKNLIPIFLDMVKQLKAAIFLPLVKLGKTHLNGERK